MDETDATPSMGLVQPEQLEAFLRARLAAGERNRKGIAATLKANEKGDLAYLYRALH